MKILDLREVMLETLILLTTELAQADIIIPLAALVGFLFAREIPGEPKRLIMSMSLCLHA